MTAIAVGVAATEAGAARGARDRRSGRVRGRRASPPSSPCVGGTLYRVKKTSIYLEPSLDRELTRAAAERGITKAELIRRTLTQAIATKRPRIRAIGVGEGPGDVSANVDRYLEGFGRD